MNFTVRNFASLKAGQNKQENDLVSQEEQAIIKLKKHMAKV